MSGPWEQFQKEEAGPWSQFSGVAPPEKQSALRQIADVPLGIAKGAAQGVRMLSDVFGAGSGVSTAIKGVETYVSDLMSAQAKQDRAEIARIMKEAEDKGILEQVQAGIKAISIAPIDTLTSAFGTAIPAIAAGVGAATLGAPAAVITGAGALMGAGMGAGTIKGSIYEETKTALKELGASEQEAEQKAQLAQSYGGKNLDQIILGTVFGGVAGAGPLEKGTASALARRILGKAAATETGEAVAKEAGEAVAKGALRQRAEAGVLEALPEALQAGQEQVAQNIALQREGMDVPTFRGAVSSATLEGLAGAGLGAAVGRAPPVATLPPAVEPPVAEAPVAPAAADLSPLTIAQKQELERQRARAERPKTAEELLAEVPLQTGKPTTPLDIERIRDEHETAVIEGLLAQDTAMTRANEVAARQRELEKQMVEGASEAETLVGGISDVDRRVREGRIFSRVQDLIDQNLPFASTAISDINQKFGVIDEPPLTDTERARVQNIMGLTQVFTDFVKLPKLAPKPVDQFAENRAMEAIIKERADRGQAKPLRAAPVAPSPIIQEAPVSRGVVEGEAIRPTGGVQPSVEKDRELVEAPVEKPSRSSEAWRTEGKTPQQLMADKVENISSELAAQIATESGDKDFEFNDLPIAVRQWAADAKIPEDDLRLGVVKALGNFEIPQARRVKVQKALSPLAAIKAPAPESGKKKQGVASVAPEVFREAEPVEERVTRTPPGQGPVVQPTYEYAEGISAAEKAARKVKRVSPSLWGRLRGTLPMAEVNDISPDRALRMLGNSRRGTTLSSLVADGELDAYLPPDMRVSSASFDETDAVEYIKDRLREGTYITFEAQMELQQIANTVADLEDSINVLLKEKEVNDLIQEAIDEQAGVAEDLEATEPIDQTAGAGAVPSEQKAQAEEPAVTPVLTSYTAEEAAAKQAGKEATLAAEKKTKAVEQERLRKAQVGKEEKARADESVKDFELGQTAEEQMTGMGDMFAEPLPAVVQKTAAAENIDSLQSKYNQAKAALEAIGPEPAKPSSEAKYFGAQGRIGAAPEDVRAYDERVKAYSSWRRKYLQLKKAEVDASNSLFRAKQLQERKSLGRSADKQLQDFQQTLRAQLNKFGLTDVGLKIEAGMSDAGSYAQQLIRIAADSANPIQTLRHESIHALRELGFFTDAQWKSLSKMAQDKWIDQYLKQRNVNGNPLKAGEESRYDAYMREYKGDMEKITEEAVSDAFGDFDATKPPAGLVQAILKRLQKLFNAIQSALTNVESVDQIFGKVEKGELKAGAREVGVEGVRKSLGETNAIEVSKADAKKFWKAADDIKRSEGVEAAEEAWIGGIADFGDRAAARDIQRMPGYQEYQDSIIASAREHLAKTAFGKFYVYRYGDLGLKDEVLLNEEYDALDPKATTLSINFAKKFKHFAGFDEDLDPDANMGWMRISVFPEAIIMVGKQSENEIVIDPNSLSPDAIEIIDESFEPSQPEARFSLRAAPPAKPTMGERLRAAGQEAYQKRKPLDTGAFKGVPEDLVNGLGDVFAPKNETILDRIDGMKDNFWQRVAQGVADQYRTIKEYSEDAYMKARLSKTIDGGLEGLMFHGQVFNDGGALNIRQKTKGLLEVLKPVGKELDRYLIWVALSRDSTMPEGKRSISDDLVSRRNELIQGTIDGQPRLELYQKIQKEMNALNRSVLKVAVDAGLLNTTEGAIKDIQANEKLTDQEKAEKIAELRANPIGYERFINDLNYIPFYKVMEEGDTQNVSTASGLTSQYFSKALKGGEKPFGDLMENTLRNWSHILSASMKNQAAEATIDAAVKHNAATPNLKIGLEMRGNKVYSTQSGEMVGDGSLRPEFTKNDKGAVKVMMDGQPTYYMVTEPLLLDAITSIGYMGPKSQFLDVAKDFKNLLQFGVTISPTFKVNNLIRDSVSAMGVSELKKNPIANVLQGISLADKNSETYIAGLAGGAIFNFGSAYEGDQSRLIKRLLKQGVARDSILDTKQRIAKGLRDSFDKYQEWGNKSESANRLALYKQLRDAGMSHLEASFKARDLLDFSMQGSWPAFRILTQVIPFLNARIQGLYKLGRDGITPTYRVLYNSATGKEIVESDKQKAQSFMIVTTAVGLASAALYLAFKDDEDYKKRDDWDRDNFWWIKLPGMDSALRIPKPFEIGAFGTLVERTLEQILDSGAEGKQFTDSLSRTLSSTFAMNPIPQVIKPLYDIYANKDSFTGAPIESAGLEKLSKQERQIDTTSPLAIALGGVTSILPEAMELSPVQVDYMIKGYFGWLGGTAASISMGAVAPFKDGEYPDTRWMDKASLGLVKQLPSPQSKYVTAFYESNKEISQAFADMRHYQTIGDTEKAMEILEDKGDLIALSKMYDRVAKDMGSIRTQIRIVTNDPEMSGEAKQEAIERMKMMLGLMAQQAEELRKSRKP